MERVPKLKSCLKPRNLVHSIRGRVGVLLACGLVVALTACVSAENIPEEEQFSIRERGEQLDQDYPGEYVYFKDKGWEMYLPKLWLTYTLCSIRSHNACVRDSLIESIGHDADYIFFPNNEWTYDHGITFNLDTKEVEGELIDHNTVLEARDFCVPLLEPFHYEEEKN